MIRIFGACGNYSEKHWKLFRKPKHRAFRAFWGNFLEFSFSPKNPTYWPRIQKNPTKKTQPIDRRSPTRDIFPREILRKFYDKIRLISFMERACKHRKSHKFNINIKKSPAAPPVKFLEISLLCFASFSVQ